MYIRYGTNSFQCSPTLYDKESAQTRGLLVTTNDQTCAAELCNGTLHQGLGSRILENRLSDSLTSGSAGTALRDTQYSVTTGTL